MKFMPHLYNKKNYRIIRFKIVQCLLLILVLGCTTETKIHKDNTNKLLSNGKILMVEKASTIESTRGILGKHKYNISHSYQYNFSIDDGDYYWEANNAEPKHVLFCKDSVYVHYLKEKYLRSDQGSDTTLIYQDFDYEHVILDVYEVYLDKRYFFNLFGYALWVDIPQSRYVSKRSTCEEFDIPNDNELVKN